MNCHECKYRAPCPGSAHSKCWHPVAEKIQEDPIVTLMGVFASVGRSPTILMLSQVLDGLEQLDIKLNPTGVEHNWANWPVNFDPAWILQCKGFEEK